MSETDAVLSQHDTSPLDQPAPAPQPANTLKSKGETRALIHWQKRLLPFMISFMTVMALLFFLFSGLHIYQVTRFIQSADGLDTRAQISAEINKPTGRPISSDEVMEHSLLLLEADALDKRYHQAGGLLMSRIWSRQLAFITGMVMAFVGAAFILGKLSEDTTEVSGGAAEWKVAISSASPGIILSFFGTVVIVASLFVRASLDVSDGPAYVQALHPGATTVIGVDATPNKKTDLPLDLKEMESLGPQKEKSGTK